MEDIKLTQYSHGAGCGCKISPAILETIIGKSKSGAGLEFPNLLVGNSSKDDAAVMDIGNGQVAISTTDFFMPIVDDPFDFGRIASANAISDIYAMGGKPIMAIAILGWPINTVPAEVAAKVLDGARAICAEAGIPLAGGHSIDCPEPVFGLAVTGLAKKEEVKMNSKAQVGDLLFLTKPLGVGILSTASKKGKLKPEHLQVSIDNMTKLNKIGYELSKLKGVHAMTDVTGFGLLGHSLEMCEGSGVSAEITFDYVQFLPHVLDYLDQGCVPGGTGRNWASYGQHVSDINEKTKNLLADPQTSGGLLVAVNPNQVEEFKALMNEHGYGEVTSNPIGRITSPQPKRVSVI